MSWSRLHAAGASEAAVFAAVVLLSFSVYLATLAPTITWRFGGSDSGELAAAAYTWGVAHPTGYPTWTVLGFLITRLPLGEPAWRTNLLSAAAGAGAAGFIGAAAFRLSAITSPPASASVRMISAAGAGLALAVAPAFWAQSILTEVYSLNCLLLAWIVWLMLHPPSTARRNGLAVAWGLALTNHLTALFAVLLSALTVAWQQRQSRPKLRSLAQMAILFLLPLCLYALIPWRAAQHPAQNWNDPEDLPRFLRLVTGADYRYLLQWSQPLSALPSIPALTRLFIAQFAWWVLPLSLYGFALVWDKAKPLALFVLSTVAAYALFTALYRGEGAEYYLLPAYMLEAAVLGAGMATLADALQSAWHGAGGARAATFAAAGAMAMTVLPFAALRYHDHDLRRDFAARDYARSVLASTAPDGTIITHRDEQTFPLWYVQNVEGIRRDVRVIDVRLGTRSSDVPTNPDRRNR